MEMIGLEMAVGAAFRQWPRGVLRLLPAQETDTGVRRIFDQNAKKQKFALGKFLP